MLYLGMLFHVAYIYTLGKLFHPASQTAPLCHTTRRACRAGDIETVGTAKRTISEKEA